MSLDRVTIGAALVTALVAAAVAGAATARVAGDNAATRDLRVVQSAAAGVAADSDTPAADVVDAVNRRATALTDGVRVLVADIAADAPETRTAEKPTNGADPSTGGTAADANPPSASRPSQPSTRAASNGPATLVPDAAMSGATDVVDVLVGVGPEQRKRVRVVLDPEQTRSPAAIVAALTAAATLIVALASAGLRSRSVRPATGGRLGAGPTDDDPPDRTPPHRLPAQPAPAAVEQLVDELLDLVPQLPEALAWRLEQALAAAGVVAFTGDGESFDPDRHEAVGTASTPCADDAGRVASTVRTGYRSATSVLRPARVVVYAHPPTPADKRRAAP